MKCWRVGIMITLMYLEGQCAHFKLVSMTDVKQVFHVLMQCVQNTCCYE